MANQASYISVTKQSGTNTVNVAKSVLEKLDELRQNVPGDVRFEVLSDSSQQVRTTINALVRSAIEGGDSGDARAASSFSGTSEARS